MQNVVFVQKNKGIECLFLGVFRDFSLCTPFPLGGYLKSKSKGSAKSNCSRLFSPISIVVIVQSLTFFIIHIKVRILG